MCVWPLLMVQTKATLILFHQIRLASHRISNQGNLVFQCPRERRLCVRESACVCVLTKCF